MNFENVIALCDRFIALIDEGGLLDKLDAATSISGSAKDINLKSKQDALVYAADSLKTALKGSLFDDIGLTLVEEFDGLGLSELVSIADAEALAEAAGEKPIDWESITALQVPLSASRAKLIETDKQIRSLKTVADYFGLEGRDLPKAEAFAVARMPEIEEQSPEVDAFVDHIQAFQSIINHCSDAVGSKEASNLRMISGPDAVLVADLSPAAAEKMTSMVAEVERAGEKANRIEAAAQELTDQDLPSRLVGQVMEEAGKVRAFKKLDASSMAFWSGLSQGEKAADTTELLLLMQQLEGKGVHLSAVSLASSEEAEVSEEVDEIATDVSEEASDEQSDDQSEEGIGVEAANENNADDAAVVEAEAAESSSEEVEPQSDVEAEALSEDQSEPNLAGQSVVAAAGAIVDEVKESTAEMADDATSLVEEATEVATEAVGQVVEEAEKTLDDVVETTTAKVEETADKLVEVAEDGASETMKAARNFRRTTVLGGSVASSIPDEKAEAEQVQETSTSEANASEADGTISNGTNGANGTGGRKPVIDVSTPDDARPKEKRGLYHVIRDFFQRPH